MNYATRFLDRTVEIKIDRPLDSKHPTHRYYYPVNYGFVEHTVAPDGKGVDAYVLGVFKPVESFAGRCIAVIHRLDDEDDKLILAPAGRDFSDEQIRALIEFQERFFKSEIVKK